MAKIVIGAIMLAWAAVIFLFSSQPFKQQNIQPWLRRIVTAEKLERDFGWVDFSYAGLRVNIREMGSLTFAEFFIRKAAHVTEYAILGSMLMLLLRAVFRKRKWLPPAGILLCFAFAAADEYRQSFVDGRRPLFEDVLLDTAGACLGILLTMLAIRMGSSLGRVIRTANGRERMG
ncbi:VanZ family protein [Cohnella sp. CFH 77786]|uniref:VanZ family protein n=1 Tax=Cohnella sp. CFH 77786 TaxID=2662265 RepID=UPI001C60D9DC|nr:VanZ family protein [Cohnella sp. CFH 77786]MBW5448342.1 VanZ family protein [Cohnella sp. CFH 77786]